MKKVMITGANRGIGLAIVEKFLQNDYDVIACSRKPSSVFDEEISHLKKRYGKEVFKYYFDLQDEEQVKRVVREIIKTEKRIDVLVNNAGITSATLFPMLSMTEVRDQMTVNYFAPLMISQLVSRNMMRNKKGVIINIASVSGMQNEVGRIGYGGSKAALIFASKTMSLELAQYKIRVNCVSPGFIDTDMWKNRDMQLYNQVMEETPLNRQGSVEDVANAVFFLASDEAAYITGHNIVVDGGRKL